MSVSTSSSTRLRDIPVLETDAHSVQAMIMAVLVMTTSNSHTVSDICTSNDGVTGTSVIVTGDVGGVTGTDGHHTVVTMVATLGDHAHCVKDKGTDK